MLADISLIRFAYYFLRIFRIILDYSGLLGA
jgi:hypothetical protein